MDIIGNTLSNTSPSSRLHSLSNSYENVPAWVPFVYPIYKRNINMQTYYVNSSLNQNCPVTQVENTDDEINKVNSVVLFDDINNCFSTNSNNIGYKGRNCSSEELIHVQFQPPLENVEDDAEMIIQPKITKATTLLKRKRDNNENNKVKNVVTVQTNDVRKNNKLNTRRKPELMVQTGSKGQTDTGTNLRRSKRIADKKDKTAAIRRVCNLKRNQPLKQQRNLKSLQEHCLKPGCNKKSQRAVMSCQNHECRLNNNLKRVRSCKALHLDHWDKVLLQSKVKVLFPPGVLSSSDVKCLEKSSEVRNGQFSLYPVYAHDYNLRPVEPRFLRYPLLLEKK